MTTLGLGLGWRPQLAALALRRPDLGFVEIVAESFPSDQPLPLALVEARRRGVAVIPHGVSLGLGGASPPDRRRLEHLADLAELTGAPLVSEHVAFVRADGREAGHLLPVARTRAALEVLVENVRIATEALPVPLALEPVASLFEWPRPEIGEGQLLTELIDRTGAHLLLDVANIYANGHNHGYDPTTLLDELPLDRIAYVHVAGGSFSGGIYHDTHAAAVPSEVLDLLAALRSRTAIPGAMLERDDSFPPTPQVVAELDAISTAARGGDSWAPLPRLRRPAPSRWSDRSLSASRRSLAADQSEVLRALLDGAPAPDGFDAGRVEAAAHALRRKKHRVEQLAHAGR